MPWLFLLAGCEKLGIQCEDVRAILLDGTEIDDNDVFVQLEKNVIFVLLEKNQQHHHDPNNQSQENKKDSAAQQVVTQAGKQSKALLIVWLIIMLIQSSWFWAPIFKTNIFYFFTVNSVTQSSTNYDCKQYTISSSLTLGPPIAIDVSKTDII